MSISFEDEDAQIAQYVKDIAKKKDIGIDDVSIAHGPLANRTI
jgi:hypothetical protein